MYGRDIASRILYGAQISLEVGFIIVIIGVGVGVIAGGLAGYSGGVLDTVIMRLVDVLLAFPSILLALLIASVMGPGLVSVMIAVGAVSWLTFARVVRAEILSIKERDFIIAARALGTNDLRILARHVLPNCMAPIIVLATLQMATALISAASLSFLGMGAQPPQPEWGSMLNEAQEFLREAWWYAFFPGIAIVITVLAINFVGDGLRDALDPKMRGRGVGF
jgi:peptide/nickel transport system permease protein